MTLACLGVSTPFMTHSKFETWECRGGASYKGRLAIIILQHFSLLVLGVVKQTARFVIYVLGQTFLNKSVVGSRIFLRFVHVSLGLVTIFEAYLRDLTALSLGEGGIRILDSENTGGFVDAGI